MVAALKVHAQRDAAAKVQGILSVQYFVRATVLVARVNLSWMNRNYRPLNLFRFVTMRLTTLCGTSVRVRGLLNFLKYH